MRVLQSANPRPLNLLAVGPGGLVAAAGGPPHSPPGVEAWDAATGAPRWTVLPDRANLRCVAFVLGGAHLFVADSGAQRVFRVPADGPPVEAARTGWAFAGAAAVGARAFLAVDGEHPVLRCVSLPDLTDQWRRDGGHEFRDPRTEFGGPVAVAADGSWLALSVRERGRGLPEQAVVVHDAASGVRRTTIPFDPARTVRALAFAADGERLLVLASAQEVEVYDASTGIRAGALGHPGRAPVTAVAAHPGGTVACARTDGTVTFWDPARLVSVRTFDWRAGPLASLAFGADGALGAAGTRDGQVIVWDVDL